MSPRIIFFGTPACAVPVLESLAKNFQVIGVVTASDRPVGRKKILTPSPVKVAASGLGIPIVPFAEFADLTPDLCIVAAYNKIIPASMLSLPRHGFINIHPSLLPAYRGPSPVKSAILDGCASTGVTIIALDQEMDHGPILAQASWSIPETADTDFCEAELFALGTRLLIDTIPGYITGALAPVQQDHSQATYTKKFTRDDGRLDWSQSAIRINDRIRALAANPGTWTTWGG
jgi:methionyl-tRNA formyltransferase